MKAFITGTDTGVGKTFATALLTRALRRAGLDTVALKPLCCGGREDVEILRGAADNELTCDEINPVWMRTPVAPLVASRKEGIPVSIEALASWFQQITRDRQSYLVEGAGGWLVPVADHLTVADLAAKLGLPVILVVANRLGCINHTLLTLENIRARGLKCDGIILNTTSPNLDDAMQTNREILIETSGVPVLVEIGPEQKSLDLAVV
ncbi:MAG: dethiobiotin synthase [Terrimicrobiaceae bacterium]|jgi:dethiobiotin synthetase